jgi:hypothetical protein
LNIRDQRIIFAFAFNAQPEPAAARYALAAFGTCWTKAPLRAPWHTKAMDGQQRPKKKDVLKTKAERKIG